MNEYKDLYLMYLVDLSIIDDNFMGEANKVLIELNYSGIDDCIKRCRACEGLGAAYIQDWESPDGFYYFDEYDEAVHKNVDDEFRTECDRRVSSPDDVHWKGLIKHTNIYWETCCSLELKDLLTAKEILQGFGFEKDLVLKKNLQKLIRGRAKDDAGRALVNLVTARLINDGPGEDLPILLAEQQGVLAKDPQHPVALYLKELIEKKLKED